MLKFDIGSGKDDVSKHTEKKEVYENCSLVAILTKEFGSALLKSYYLLTRDYLYSPGGFSGVHRVFVRFRPSHCAGVPQSP